MKLHVFITQNETLCPLAVISYLPTTPQPLATTNLSVSMDMPSLDISYIWSQTICDLL